MRTAGALKQFLYARPRLANSIRVNQICLLSLQSQQRLFSKKVTTPTKPANGAAQTRTMSADAETRKQTLSAKIDELIAAVTTMAESAPVSLPSASVATLSSSGDDVKRDVSTEKCAKTDSSCSRMRLKAARGTRDYHCGEMLIRDEMMEIIRRNLDAFGGQFIETPVMELRDILMDKYGEDEKLIYDLQLQDGALSESLSLRYDLTVPLARYIAMNRKRIKSPFRAARVGRVYRRDMPRMTRGRYREFWQGDLDIVRTAQPHNGLDLTFDDCEVLQFMYQSTTQLLDTAEYKKNFIDDGGSEVPQRRIKLKVNNRKVLDAILSDCGVSAVQIKPISAAIDKLDKKEWTEVRKEMVEKGISETSADQIYKYMFELTKPTTTTATDSSSLVEDSSSAAAAALPASEKKAARLRAVIAKLKTCDAIYKNSAIGKEGIDELEFLVDLLVLASTDSASTTGECLLDSVCIDMAMVRGLDYYTGMILEVVLDDDYYQTVLSESLMVAASQKSDAADANDDGHDDDAAADAEAEDEEDDDELAAIGSIGGGGRYDKLISGFVPSESFPCVGASLGFERIFTFLTHLKRAASLYGNASIDEVYTGSKSQFVVCEVGRDGGSHGFYKERLALLSELRSSGVLIRGEMVHKISPDFREQIGYAEDRSIPWMVLIGSSELANATVNLRRLLLVGDYVEVKSKDKSRNGVIVQIVRIEQPLATGKRQPTPWFFVRPADSELLKKLLAKAKKKRKKGKGVDPNAGLWRMTKKEMGRVVTHRGTVKQDIVDQQIPGLPRAELASFLANHV